MQNVWFAFVFDCFKLLPPRFNRTISQYIDSKLSMKKCMDDDSAHKSFGVAPYSYDT